MKSTNQNKKNSGASRSLRIGTYSVVATVVVLVIVILVNVLMASLPISLTAFDVTSGQLYSLSEQSKAIVDGLNKDVTIYWLVNSGGEDATIGTLLDQYTGRSGKIRVIKKDPEETPTFLEQFSLTDVEYNTLIVECGERFRYLTSTDIYQYDFTNYYTTGTYETSFAGESAVTSAIDYCISEELPKLYLLTGHGEEELSLSFESSIERENIETETLSLLTVETVPADADAVMLYGPETDITATERDMLLTYLQNGGNMLLITDPQQADSLTNLNEVMAYYGVSPQTGVIVEGSRNYYSWGNPLNLMPDLIYHEITNPLRDGGYQVMLPIAHGIIVSEDVPSSVTVSKFLTTSDSAYSKLTGYSMTTYDKEDGDVDGPFGVAVAIEEALDENMSTNIVWFGSMSILDDDVNAQISGGNEDLFLNSMNWVLDQDESRLTIHAKSLSYEYLTMDNQAALTFTILVVGIVPLAYLAVGIVVMVRRRRK